MTVDQLAWSPGNDGGPQFEHLEPEALVGARLLGAIAAWHVYDGTRSPSPVDVWLVLDPAGPVRVGVASDWQLEVGRQAVQGPYDMQEYGRIDIDVPGPDLPLSAHVGSRILAVKTDHDTTTRQHMGMTLMFDTGAVRLHSHGGNLLLEEAVL